jgi:hypothetical protein
MSLSINHLSDTVDAVQDLIVTHKSIMKQAVSHFALRHSRQGIFATACCKNEIITHRNNASAKILLSRSLSAAASSSAAFSLSST